MTLAVRHLRWLAAVVVGLGAITLEVARPQAVIPNTFIVGLTTGNTIFAFRATSPGTILGSVVVSGIGAGETLRAIDFWPSGPRSLYGITTDATNTQARLYRIDLFAAVAVPVSTSPMTIAASTDLGFSMVTTANRFRLVNSADANVRINPFNGSLAGSDVALNPAGQNVDSVASRRVAFGSPPTVYGISRTQNALVTIGGLNGTPSANGGAVTTVGPLGVALTGATGLDFAANWNGLLASLKTAAGTGLYVIDTTTGAATLIGQIGNGAVAVQSIAAFEPRAVMDVDGDGITDPAVIRNTGSGLQWYGQRSSNGGLWATGWGLPADTPIPGDYDGDGVTDAAVWRGGTPASWFTLGSITGFSGGAWGLTGDDPRGVGDFDGDGRSDVAVRRSQGGFGTFYLNRSTLGFAGFQWGVDTDAVAVGDYDGDGLDDAAVVRGDSGHLVWYVRQSSTGGLISVVWGVPGDLLAPGDYDADGATDVAVWRPATGIFYILPSGSGGLYTIPWGQNGDVPALSIFAN